MNMLLLGLRSAPPELLLGVLRVCLGRRDSLTFGPLVFPTTRAHGTMRKTGLSLAEAFQSSRLHEVACPSGITLAI